MQSKTIKISVIIPTYNSEDYIERTLDTVFTQSVLPMEVVLVDDGSIDQTVNTVKNYMNVHLEASKRIQLIEQKNEGAGAARNNGIRHANGNWIMFLDSDDLWEKDKIKVVIETIQKHPQINVVTHNEYEVIGNYFENRHLIYRNRDYDETKDLFLQLYRGNMFSTSCMTIQKEIIDKVGKFDETLLSAQDYDLWIRVGLYGKVIYLEEPLATYVIRRGNITSNTYRRYLCEMKICKKYANEVRKRIGERDAQKIIKARVLQIHKVEAYLALKNKQIITFLKIVLNLLKVIFIK